MTFQLDGPAVLSRSTVDRQEPLRDDENRQRELWPSARVLFVGPGGRFPVTPDGDLALVPAAHLGPSIVDGALLLGEQDGTAYWAIASPPSRDAAVEGRTAPGVAAAEDRTPAADSAAGEDRAPAADSAAGEDRALAAGRAGGDDRAPAAGRAGGGRAGELPSGMEWTDLRRSGAALDATAAGLAVTAVAVLGWHGRSPFCPACGGRSASVRAGWARRCPSCRLEEYPRTDPAVICLVHDGADHVLLARGPEWPPGRFSVLAGFVEAGESLEACVVREVEEEVGVVVHDVRYLGSQPWPFPRSLMIGFEARADRAAPVRLADGEIAEARWVHRDDVRKSLDSGSWAGRTGAVHGDAAPGELLLPGPVSIAGHMLRCWSAAG